MAIILSKIIRRQLLHKVTHGRDRGKDIIVELRPGDEISFRVKGTRQIYTVFLGYCYKLAQIQTVDVQYREAMDKYKAKKAAGYKRLRKPKRPSMPFSNLYYKALK